MAWIIPEELETLILRPRIIMNFSHTAKSRPFIRTTKQDDNQILSISAVHTNIRLTILYIEFSLSCSLVRSIGGLIIRNSPIYMTTGLAVHSPGLTSLHFLITHFVLDSCFICIFNCSINQAIIVVCSSSSSALPGVMKTLS